MSDDGLVKIEYTIDGEGKPDGGRWETDVEACDWDCSPLSEIAEEIASEHYEVYGPIGDPVEIAIYQDNDCVAKVKLAKAQPIVRYQAIKVTDIEELGD